MSAVTQATDVFGRLRAAANASDQARDRTRRLGSVAVTFIVFGYSAVELVSLAFRHTQGAELYGVAVAALAVVAAAAGLALLASGRRRVLTTAAVLFLWALVAIGGIGGTVAHVVGPEPGYGPVDPRPRPVTAPLIFTALGLVGGAALFYGQRAGAARIREP